jgi:hypothetical protein
MDDAARKSARRVAANGRRSAAHLETEARNVAKRIAHHGPANLVETMRQRANVNLNPQWAEDLCREYGWKP